MNIHAFYPCPYQSAFALDDARCSKMVLESAQLISMVNGGPYKFRHAPKPIALWIQDQANFSWVCNWHRALAYEHHARKGTWHKSWREVGSKLCIDDKYKDVKSFVNYTISTKHGLDFTHIEDTHIAYREYITTRWENDKRQPKWSTGFLDW